MNNLQNNELERIENEIVMLKTQAAQNLMKIGLKLIDAKKMIPYGEWSKWLDEKVGFSQRTANNLMRVAKELNVNSQAISNLESTKLIMLLELPVEEREDFLNQNELKNMSTREMKESIKQYKRNSDIYKVLDRERDTHRYEIEISKLNPFPKHEEYFWNMKGKEYIEFLQSIENRGVICPIIITRDNMVLSGHQRVRACRDLGIETIPNYYACVNNSHDNLEKQLLSIFLTSNMITRSPVFWLACAWDNLLLGDGTQFEYYKQKFIDEKNPEREEWIEKFSAAIKRIM